MTQNYLFGGDPKLEYISPAPLRVEHIGMFCDGKGIGKVKVTLADLMSDGNLVFETEFFKFRHPIPYAELQHHEDFYAHSNAFSRLFETPIEKDLAGLLRQEFFYVLERSDPKKVRAGEKLIPVSMQIYPGRKGNQFGRQDHFTPHALVKTLPSADLEKVEVSGHYPLALFQVPYRMETASKLRRIKYADEGVLTLRLEKS